MDKQFESLKSLHRDIRDGLGNTLSLRIHRSLSWLQCAETIDDIDVQFITLWIAFNAAYAQEFKGKWSQSERENIGQFLKTLISLDKTNTLYNLVWSEFSGAIRLLLDNQFVYQKFWDYQMNIVSEKDWMESFTKEKDIAQKALVHKNTSLILSIIFERLYTLRNQMIHGGATWKSQVNRSQIKDGVCILHKVIPSILMIMMNEQPELSGEPIYPVIDN